jgi:hypothetical protein
MSWTKKQLIDQAFSEIGFGPDFNVTADECENALRRLDSMMAEWNGKGIRVSYALPGGVDESNIDDDSGLPDVANEAVFMNLAIRLAPGYGKQLSQDTRITAKQGYNTLLSRAVFPTPQPMPSTMPRGAGNRPWQYGNGNPFYPEPAIVIDAGADDPLNF